MSGGGGGSEDSQPLEYTPTWVLAVVCFVIVLISLLVERGIHRLGKFFKRKKQDSLYDALEKLKEELMLLGFISLLLTVAQGLIGHLCIPAEAASVMLPCIKEIHDPSEISHFNIINNGKRRLLVESLSSSHCVRKGKVPMLSLEALHQLHIFIFVLAVVHVIFCVSTMVLGGFKIRQWKHWENSIRDELSKPHRDHHSIRFHNSEFIQRAGRYWRKFKVISVIVAFFKQFYGSVTKSDYIALRRGFIRAHCPSRPKFDFHNYMLRTLEYDFKKIVGISWYLWLFVILFLLMNIAGWHTYFWLSFLPLILLLMVGCKLEYIITKLAKEVAESRSGEGDATSVKPSDELFWFHKPALVLYLIHFILFQNSFEIAFFFWIWFTRGFKSCIMEELAFIIPRLIVGVIVQVLCSYSTLPLYALVSQMGSMFKQGMFDSYIEGLIMDWANPGRRESSLHGSQSSNMIKQSSFDSISLANDEISASVIELSHQNRPQISLS